MSEIEIHPLQRARKKLGIKQKVLADLTGLSEPTIKRAERGSPLEDYTISALCEYFSKRFGRQVHREELGLRAKWEENDGETIIQNREPIQTVSRQLPSSEKADYHTSNSPETLTIGGLPIKLIVLARGRYGPGEVHCYYDHTPIQLLPEFERMKEALIDDLEERKAKGEVKLAYNSNTYKLKEFDTGYREIVNSEEIP
jgi:transcriptional regulator with XRE-family HTH domain